MPSCLTKLAKEITMPVFLFRVPSTMPGVQLVPNYLLRNKWSLQQGFTCMLCEVKIRRV